jgi:hypothetical protein
MKLSRLCLLIAILFVFSLFISYFVREPIPGKPLSTAAPKVVNAHPAGNRVGPDYLYPDSALTPGATNPQITQANIDQNWPAPRFPASYK